MPRIRKLNNETPENNEVATINPVEQREAVDLVYDDVLKSYKLVKVKYNIEDAKVINLNNRDRSVAMYKITKYFAEKTNKNG